VDEFTNQIIVRIRAARAALAVARAAGDDYLAGVREGELDSLNRLAATHDVTLSEVTLSDLERRESA